MTQNSIKDTISKWSQKCDIFDIELIIAHIIQKDQVFIMTHSEHILTKKQQKQISLLCQKRFDGYPLAYILKHKEFYARDFIINEHTLVPRPETELLITETLSFISKKKLSDILIIDIGTGSGIIAVTLAKELSKKNIQTTIRASDISSKALVVAKQNTKLHQVNITFYNSNLLNNHVLQNDIINTKCKNIIIVSNLPYVDIKQKDNLLKQPESQALYFEPSSALWSSDNGLLHYKKLILQTIALQSNLDTPKKITSFYEIDPAQLNLLTDYLSSSTSESYNIKYFKDLSGKNRIVRWN